MRFASEDIGMADPQALVVAMAAQQAVHFVGLPEGNLALAEAVSVYGDCAEEQFPVYGIFACPGRDKKGLRRTCPVAFPECGNRTDERG